MSDNAAVFFSFCLYVLYVLLPLVPAIIIFKLFPDTKVTLSGPLQHFTINATGAFGAYVATVALGFFLVRNVEAQIQWSRYYPVEGAIVNLGQNEGFNSDTMYWRYNSAGDFNGMNQIRDYSFVLLLNHPVLQPETVWLNYWANNGSGGGGTAPLPKRIPMRLLAETGEQRFRMDTHDGEPVIVPETQAESSPKKSPPK
jgi:hypothetical protein